MTSKIATTVAAFATIFLLTVPSIAFASSKQSFSLTLAGGFVNIANQHYRQSGGNLVAFSSTNPDASGISPSTARIHYSLDATVSGASGNSPISVSGQATLKVSVGGSDENNGKGSGNDKGSGDDHEKSANKGTTLEVQATLLGMIPAAGLPLDPSQPLNPFACLPDSCTSEIPAFFVGTGDLKVTSGGKTTDTPLGTIIFESAYLNPFGAPLVIATTTTDKIGIPDVPDGMLLIVATYKSQTSEWTGVQTAGDVYDLTSSTPTTAIGHFSLTSNLVENIVKGTEKDTGLQMTLFGFDSSSKYSVLNSVGKFRGTSTIPREGTPCLAWPFGPGTCLMTGAHSTGSFNLRSNEKGTHIGGRYDLAWSVPALGFTGTVGARIGEEGDD